MSLSARERRTLESIEDQLAGSDPTLASLLSAFTRLASAEEMPARERIALRHRLRPTRGRHPRLTKIGRRLRELDRSPGFRQSGLLLGLAITIALISIGLTIRHNAGNAGVCAERATCARPIPARVGWKFYERPSGAILNGAPPVQEPGPRDHRASWNTPRSLDSSKKHEVTLRPKMVAAS